MEKYAETISELHRRRLEVVSFDWQGQGMSDHLLPVREKGYVRSYDDYLADLDLIIHSVVLPGMRGPLYLLCHSMGGHIGLRYLAEADHRVEKAVFCAPMVDIDTSPFPSFLVRCLSRLQVAAGLGHKVMMGSARRNPFPDRFEGNILTSDHQRFLRNRKMVTDRPELSAARVTCGWLTASYESIDILKRPETAAALKIPLLFVCAGDDHIVSNRALRNMAAEVDGSRLVTVGAARHEILQETDPLRSVLWQAFDRFLDPDGRL
jgi:lysophospholipase